MELTAVHVGHEAAAELDHGDAAHRHVGVIGAGGMSLHSFLDGVALDEKLTFPDGMHPNAEGVAKIVEGILPKVEELLARVEAKS